jgi:hypothetical protein
MAPLVSERIVLIKQVVFALVEDGAVGIVHPVPGGGEVELRAMWFVVTL